MRLRSAYLGCLIAAMVTLSGCVSPHGIVAADVDPLGWSEQSPCEVVFENEDTLVRYDLNLFIRYNKSFPLQEVTLNVMTQSPDSLYVCEPVTLSLPFNPGEPADLLESQVLYRSAVVFSIKGKYRFKITPAGTQTLIGVVATGFDFRQVE